MKYAIRYDTTLFVREAISAVYHHPVHRGRAGARGHPPLPAELPRHAGSRHHRAGHHHRRLHRNGRTRVHREPHDPVRPDPGHRHRGGRRHHHRGEQLLLHRARDAAQGSDHPGHGRAHRPGAGHHPGAGRGLPARRLPTRHHRADIPPVRARHRRDRGHQRNQRAHLEAGPVRDVAEAPRRQAAELVLPRVQPGVRGRDQGLRGRRRLDGEAHGAR